MNAAATAALRPRAFALLEGDAVVGETVRVAKGARALIEFARDAG